MSAKTQEQPKGSTSATINLNDRAVKSLADAIYKHLQDEGCQAKDIINVSSQLLGLVSNQIRENQPSS